MQKKKYVKRRLPKYRKNGIIIHNREYLKLKYGKYKYGQDRNRAYIIPLYVVKNKSGGGKYFNRYFSYVDVLLERLLKWIFKEMGKTARDITITKMRMFLWDYGIELVDKKKQYQGGFSDRQTGHQKIKKEDDKDYFDITTIIK